MREKKYFLLLVFITISSYCQIPNFEHNFTKKDTLENPLFETFLKDYEFVITYSDACCSKQYKILALKNGKWRSWTYSDNFIQWTKKNNESKITVDTIKLGTFFEGENGKKVKENHIKKLLAKFSENDFWKLENDSLNQSRIIETYFEDGDTIKRKAIITDGTNYVFNIITQKN